MLALLSLVRIATWRSDCPRWDTDRNVSGGGQAVKRPRSPLVAHDTTARAADPPRCRAQPPQGPCRDEVAECRVLSAEAVADCPPPVTEHSPLATRHSALSTRHSALGLTEIAVRTMMSQLEEVPRSARGPAPSPATTADPVTDASIRCWRSREPAGADAAHPSRRFG